MITIETVKVTTKEGTQYLYHAGALRSHTIYSYEVDLPKIDFHHMDYDQLGLLVEQDRIEKLVPEAKVEIVKIIVDEDYKFIEEGIVGFDLVIQGKHKMMHFYGTFASRDLAKEQLEIEYSRNGKSIPYKITENIEYDLEDLIHKIS